MPVQDFEPQKCYVPAGSAAEAGTVGAEEFAQISAVYRSLHLPPSISPIHITPYRSYKKAVQKAPIHLTVHPTGKAQLRRIGVASKRLGAATTSRSSDAATRARRRPPPSDLFGAVPAVLGRAQGDRWWGVLPYGGRVKSSHCFDPKCRWSRCGHTFSTKLAKFGALGA